MIFTRLPSLTVYFVLAAGFYFPLPAVSQTSKAAPACSDCGTIRAINERRPKGEGAWKNNTGDRGLDGLERKTAGSSSASSTTSGTNKTYTRESANGSISSIQRDAQSDDAVLKKRLWEVVIAMDGGGVKVIEYPRRPALQTGDKVKVQGKEVFVR